MQLLKTLDFTTSTQGDLGNILDTSERSNKTLEDHGTSKHGAKHSPPGGKFQKSEGPPVAGADTPFHKVSYGQIVST